MTVNGEKYELTTEMTLAELICERGLNPGLVVVEYNGSIVRAGDFAGIKLSDGDVLEILRFMGGG